MNSVVFQTAAGAPFAELVMSMPVERERVGMFFRKPADFDGAETRALKPRPPNQYACHFLIYDGTTTVSFVNDDGWRITAQLDATDKGSWLADRAGERLQGQAQGVHFEPEASSNAVTHVVGKIR